MTASHRFVGFRKPGPRRAGLLSTSMQSVYLMRPVVYRPSDTYMTIYPILPYA